MRILNRLYIKISDKSLDQDINLGIGDNILVKCSDGSIAREYILDIITEILYHLDKQKTSRYLYISSHKRNHKCKIPINDAYIDIGFIKRIGNFESSSIETEYVIYSDDNEILYNGDTCYIQRVQPRNKNSERIRCKIDDIFYDRIYLTSVDGVDIIIKTDQNSYFIFKGEK